MKQFIVIGGGRFGEATAKTLTESGQEVMVVDMDEEWVKLSMTDKKGQTKTKLIRIEDIRSIEL